MRDELFLPTGNRRIRTDRFGLYLSAYADNPATLICFDQATLALNHHFPRTADLGPHVAFCRGSLPPPLYADWLEENGVEVPLPFLNLLRGW